ncbi:MAG: sigma-54-dependent Fis family transcriptional regulator [Candidatus Latescibacteria bacterium]|nr:sigma-54-dependent Fis family transcriptional regulator [Candidatus Latescibacterota bacterium]
MSSVPRVAVVDDDPVLLDILQKTLTGRGYDVAVFPDGTSFLGALEVGETPDVAVLDIRLPGPDGVELLKRLHEDIPACRVVMMTAYKSMESMLDSLRYGAIEYLMKPLTAGEVADAVEQSLLKRRRLDRISEGTPAFDVESREEVSELARVMGPSAAVADIEAFVKKAGRSDVPVLISGETGTGKEVVARAIHAASGRRALQMMVLNCGAIPEPLIESELYGHMRGAFTGAHTDQQGLIETADGSTLFLDEVGELPQASQVKLLRVLQEGEVRRLGSRSTKRVDVRVIAATNSDLEHSVAVGSFRRDLFYRLNVLKLRLPPLRERKEDIPHLLDRFLELYSRRKGGVTPEFSKRAMRALHQYPWPGNVRELENEVARAVTLVEADSVKLKDLSEEIMAVQQIRGAGSLKAAMDMKERQLILSTLELTGWNKTEAAKMLGMSRQNLYQRLNYHVIPPNPPTSGSDGVKPD